MEEIAAIRYKELEKSFYNALIIGGPGGFPKPIEFHAHDTQRYVGDIFAWIHQACLGEREMLETLFGFQSTTSMKH